MTPALQQILKLRTVSSTASCPSLTQLYPGSQVTAHPANATFDILLAESAFDPQLRGDELTYGGFALLSNYRIYGMQMTGSGTQHFYQGQFESGGNWQNWILRNNSSFSAGNNSSQYQFNETTLGRSISSLRAQLQLGQINSQGSLFGGTPLNGVQLYSDSALQNAPLLVVPITGVAQTAATVEVMQNGRLLYRTLVPAGPFQLDRINNVVNGQILQVSVMQEDGQRQQFSMTASNRPDYEAMSEPLYQLAIGQYRKRSGNDDVETPLVFNIEGSLRFQQTDHLAGFQFTERYQSLAGRLDRQWGEEIQVGSSLGGQYAHNSDNQGQQWDASISTPLGPASFGVSSLYRSRHYPTLDETLRKNNPTPIGDDENPFIWWRDSETKMTHSASVNWGDADWGRISYTLGYTHYYGNKSGSVLHTVSYGKKIQTASLNTSYQGGNNRDHRLFVNLTIPFGRNASLSTRVQQYQNDTSLTTTFNHRPNNLLGYTLGASHSHDTQRVNGSINATTPYSQLAGSGSWSDDNAHSLMFSSSGALAYADGLFATSPVALGDSFGVLRIPGQYGVQVNTMGGGTSLTNHLGIAVIPTLPTNRKTTVQLNTRNLPLNVRLDTTSFDVTVARGTVISRDIPAIVMSQLLLNITLSDGTPARQGSSVIDNNGQLIGVVMGNGNVLLSNEQIGRSIRLRMANQVECQVNYSAPINFDPNLLYDEVDALCQ
ncbi:outer membrane usher protein FimD/PapC [Klebsiella sp. BIGb0407]|nr:outer membrane usher protein FimD/PapC [Klebsiella sp. BIGb0407]